MLSVTTALLGVLALESFHSPSSLGIASVLTWVSADTYSSLQEGIAGIERTVLLSSAAVVLGVAALRAVHALAQYRDNRYCFSLSTLL